MADHSDPPKAEAENGLGYNSTSPYACMTCLEASLPSADFYMSHIIVGL